MDQCYCLRGNPDEVGGKMECLTTRKPAGAQSFNVLRDTSLNEFGSITVSYTVQGDLSQFANVSVCQYLVENGDTTSLFLGVYDYDEDDPSAFATIHVDEINDYIDLEVGTFDIGEIDAKVLVTRLDGVIEEFDFN